jgi:hypothetical protein
MSRDDRRTRIFGPVGDASDWGPGKFPGTGPEFRVQANVRPCQGCGLSYTPHRWGDTDGEVRRSMEEQGICITCLFWQGINPRDPRIFNVGGLIFMVADETARGVRGFAGREVKFWSEQKKQMAVTTNAMLLGRPPHSWREDLATVATMT